MNIGLMFVHEQILRYEKINKKKTDKLIQINLDHKILLQIL